MISIMLAGISLGILADSCQELSTIQYEINQCQGDFSNKREQELSLLEQKSQLSRMLNSNDIEYDIKNCRRSIRSTKADNEEMRIANEDFKDRLDTVTRKLKNKRANLAGKVAFWECVLADRKNMTVFIGSGASARRAYDDAHSKTNMFRKHGVWTASSAQLNFEKRDRRQGGGIKVHNPTTGAGLGFCFQVYKSQGETPLESPVGFVQ